VGSDAPGSVHLVLADNVVHLDPEPAVFAAMLEGWRRQQSAAFFSPSSTIRPRLRMIRRMGEFTGQYPWQWTPAEGEAFIDHLRGGERPITVSIVHRVEYEGDPRRRPLDYDEIQALFDAADARPGKIRELGRKGALCAVRDAVVLKAMYACGLRRTETSKLDVVDLRRNRSAPRFGRCGRVQVRFGKASKGSPPKRRSVLLVPEMDWVVDALEFWLGEVRPRFSPGSHPALWITERVGGCRRVRSTRRSWRPATTPGWTSISIRIACATRS
jgi:integrase/recombinase XerC